ncbi:MAG: hypothetical protein F4Z55_13675, partial [Boseongicola sp. SB0667_bin_21]|nr:hypothetical protein [Boseongicola sp. SB0667_bin_21]
MGHFTCPWSVSEGHLPSFFNSRMAWRQRCCRQHLCGWCGRVIAQCFRAFGGKVAIVEIDEIKALEACHDECWVDRLEDFLDWAEARDYRRACKANDRRRGPDERRPFP